MKFGKRLQSQIDETLPEWRDKYLSYKQLKKRLKSIAAPDCFTDAAFSSPDHDLPPTPPNPDRIPPVSDGSHGSSAPPPPPSEVHNSSLDSPGDGSVLTASKSSSGSVPDDCASHGFFTADEADFIHLLNAELEKFNTFFMEKEEEYVIRLQVNSSFVSLSLAPSFLPFSFLTRLVLWSSVMNTSSRKRDNACPLC
jgi:hypothetical protein